MGQAVLFLYQGERTRLSFTKRISGQVPLPDRKADELGVRSSPIFAVDATQFELPDLSAELHLGFYTFDRPYERIGKIQREVAAPYLKYLWYTLGLPSFFVASPTSDLIDLVEELAGPGIRAKEYWKLNQGYVELRKHWIAEIPKGAQVPLAITEPSDSLELPSDVRTMVADVCQGLEHLSAMAARMLPEELPNLLRLRDETADVVIKAIVDLHAAPGVDDAKERQYALHTALDYLTQIHSLLSYSQSQLFGGAIPLIENPSNITGHTFLGVGSAVRALNCFRDRVDQALTEIPVIDIVKKMYSRPGPVDPARAFSKYNPGMWDAIEPIDSFEIQLADGSAIRPHLMSFSGRNGYQEAHFAISAAVQSLWASDSVQWSLMTLSHELMHAHVRELLCAIFNAQTPQVKWTESAFSSFYAEFMGMLDNGDVPKTRQSALRCAVLNFCAFHYRRRVGDGVVEHLRPSAEKLRKLLENRWKDINELLVHVLDFEYFYQGQTDVYLHSLWETWATVPSVFDNPKHYILRSLASISVRKRGFPTDRWPQAVEDLQKALSRMLDRDPQNALALTVQDILNDGDQKEELYQEYVYWLYLSEFFAKTLVSSKVHAALLRDDLLSVTGESVRYLMDTMEFVPETISSPVAFLSDRLMRHLRTALRDDSLAERSAWVFLVCSSAKVEDR